MDILTDLSKLHDKWDSEGGKSGDDGYEDALYKCINELADLIISYTQDNKALKSDAETPWYCKMCMCLNGAEKTNCINCNYIRTA